MKCRTNQIMLMCLVLCLAILACQLSPLGKNNETGKLPETEKSGGITKTLFDGIAKIFGQTRSGINIGGMEPQGFSLVGQLGGSTVAVAVKDNLAVLGQGPRIITLDVSNPKSPKVLGESQVLPGLVMGIELIDDTVYAAAMYGGLHILDVSNPAKINLISSVTPNIPGCDGITIKADVAYLACNPAGLFIVDVKNPKEPEILYQDSKSKGASFSLAFIDGCIYMVNTSTYELIVFDVSSPGKPEIIGKMPFSDLSVTGNSVGSVASVRPCGKYLCLAADQDGLIVLNVSDPAKPTIAGQLDTQVASGLAVDGNTVYLADDMDGIHIVDISNPEKPGQVGLLPTAVGGWELTVKELGERGLFIQGKYLYITDPAYGLTIAEVSPSGSVDREGSYMTPLPDVLSDIRLAGNTAYVTGRNSGFRTVDISQPDHPKELFYDDSRKNLYSQNPSGLIVHDQLAYLTDKNYPFRMYDISNPDKPVERGALFDEAASDGAFDLVLNKDLAYLSGWGLKDAFYPGKGIWVVDVSNPDHPKAVNFVDVANEDWILSLAKDHLYALDATMDLDHDGQKEPISLRVFDLSEPEKPKEVKTIPLTEAKNLSPMDMTTDGDRLYIHILPATILVFDLSKPESPEKLVTIPIQGGMPDILKDGKYLFLGGTTAYNIAKPDKPDFAGISGNLQAWDLAIEKNMVYVITTFQGMYIFRFNPLK